MVAMPKKAMIHIQKMAPGPPVRMAPAEPTMLPVPTWAAMAVARAWKELMPLVMLSAPQGQVAEYLPHALAEAAHLDEAGPDGVPQAHRNEQEDQDVAGQVVVDVYNDGIERGF